MSCVPGTAVASRISRLPCYRRPPPAGAFQDASVAPQAGAPCALTLPVSSYSLPLLPCCLPADYVDFLTSVTPENQEEFMMQVGCAVEC